MMYKYNKIACYAGRWTLILIFTLIHATVSAQLGEKDQNGQTYGDRDMAKTAAQTAKGNTPYSPMAVDKNAVNNYVKSIENNRVETPAERLARVNAENKYQQNYSDEKSDRAKDNVIFIPAAASGIIDKSLGTCEGDCLKGRGNLTFKDGSVFKGYFKNGKADSLGQLGKDKINFTVCFYRNGIRNGNASIYSKEGVLNLLYKNNVAYGSAIFKLKNGDIRRYNYNNGFINGLSVYTFANSDYVEDLYEMGKKITTLRSKKGTNIYPSSMVLNAKWVFDEDLNAKKSYLDGDFYSGERNSVGKRHGKGIYGWSNGRFYNGNWRNRDMNGFGRMTYPNGDYYEGEFRNGLKSGNGILSNASGVFYEGSFSDDKMNGKGKLTWPSGKYIIGKFKDDSIDGEGQEFLPNGYFAERTYNMSKITSSKYFDSSKNTISLKQYNEADQ